MADAVNPEQTKPGLDDMSELSDAQKIEVLHDALVKEQQDKQLLQQRFDSLVLYVQKQLQMLDQRTNAIDSVAFAALALHEGKEFVVGPELVANTRTHIESVNKGMNAYKEKLQKAAEKARAKEEKAAAKKAEVEAKRALKKGPKSKVNKTDVESEENSN